MRYLIIAIAILFSLPVYADSWSDLNRQLQDNFDQMQIESEIRQLRTLQENRWREEDERREQEKADRELKEIHKQIENEYRERTERLQRHMEGK